METHDFYDGRGPVPAHRHPNGGGWVSDDSKVDPLSIIDEGSSVSSESRVSGGSLVSGSQVSGGSTVSGSRVSESRVSESTVSGSQVSRSQVSGSTVSGSQVSRALIENSRDMLVIGPLGSRDDRLTITFKNRDGTPAVKANTGCWSGTLDEFEARVKEVHGDSKHGREYLATVAYVRALIETRRKEEEA